MLSDGTLKLTSCYNIIQIREDSRKGVYVENLKEVEVTNAREVLLQLIQVCGLLSNFSAFNLY